MYMSSLLRLYSRFRQEALRATTILAAMVALMAAGDPLHAQTTEDLFIRVGTVTASSGTVIGNTIYLSGDNSEIRFPIIYGNRSSKTYNVTNGFVIFGDDDGLPPTGGAPLRGTGSAFWGFSTANGGNYKFGSPSGPVSGLWIDSTGYYPKSDFGILYKFICFGCDGHGADTVIFAGASGDPEQMGVRPNDSGEFFSIRIQARLSDTGKWICLDSTTNFPPSNEWKWAPLNCQSGPCANGFPTWSGPECFVIRADAGGLREIGNCVPALHSTSNATVSYDFNTSGGDQSQVKWSMASGVGSIDSVTGVYTVDGLAAGTYPVTIAMSDPQAQWPTDECSFDVEISYWQIANCPDKLIWYNCDGSTYDFDVARETQDGVRWKVNSGGGAIDSLTGVYWAKNLSPMPYPGVYPIVVAAYDPANPGFTATCSFGLEIRECGFVSCPTKVVGTYCDTITYDFNMKGGPSTQFRFAMLEGPGVIDSLTGLYSAAGVLPGKYQIKVAATDTRPQGWTYQCWFDLWVSQCGIVSCPDILEGVTCRPIAYDFNGDGPDQSVYRWKLTSGPGEIDSLTGLYHAADVAAGLYPLEILMASIADSTATATCAFNLTVASCGIANCLSKLTWNTCRELTWNFNMVGADQAGYRWFLVSGVGSIETYSGLYRWNGVEAGSFPVTIGVYDDLSSMDTAYCSFTVEISASQLTLGCPGGTHYVDIGQTQYQFVSTLESCGPVKFFVTSSTLHGAVLDTMTGVVKYTGDAADADFMPHCMTIGATDEKDTAYCQVCWTIDRGCAYDVTIGHARGALLGGTASVDIILSRIDSSMGLGGFEFVVAYDAAALTLTSVEPGGIVPECGWEYFSYRPADNPNCSSGCPSGLVMIVAVADLINFESTPTCQSPKYVGNLPVSLANMSFAVTTDRVWECQLIPIRFYWTDCASNLLSGWEGTTAFLNCHVRDWDNDQPIEDPYGGLPGYSGAPNSCLILTNHPPVRNVQLQNGFVEIVCADSIDSRGDLNLNGVAYEIADVVMFLNYFISGPGAFGDHVEGSIVSSDVNGDGIQLSIPDLVLMIRIILGETGPLPKELTTPTAEIFNDNGRISISGVDALGGAFFVFKGDVEPTSTRTDFLMYHAFDGVNTRVLALMPFQNVSEARGFTGELFDVPNGEIVSVELADIGGNRVESSVGLPVTFDLRQNYPNPFNPATTISFDSPKGGAYKITVFNAAGQKVTELSGIATVGTNSVELNLSGNSSGVYLFRLETEGYSATRKAVLLK